MSRESLASIWKMTYFDMQTNDANKKRQPILNWSSVHWSRSRGILTCSVRLHLSRDVSFSWIFAYSASITLDWANCIELGSLTGPGMPKTSHNGGITGFGNAWIGSLSALIVRTKGFFGSSWLFGSGDRSSVGSDNVFDISICSLSGFCLPSFAFKSDENFSFLEQSFKSFSKKLYSSHESRINSVRTTPVTTEYGQAKPWTSFWRKWINQTYFETTQFLPQISVETIHARVGCFLRWLSGSLNWKRVQNECDSGPRIPRGQPSIRVESGPPSLRHRERQFLLVLECLWQVCEKLRILLLERQSCQSFVRCLFLGKYITCLSTVWL